MGGGMGGMGDEESESTAIEPGEGALPGALSALFGINQAFEEGEQQVAFSPTGQELILPEGIKIMDVWIEGMGEAEHEGKAELYFFPHGYTQHAYIHLESSNGVIYTISVAPLTGKVKIFDYFKEAPE
ncbi:hypothetical protein KAI87_03310, partial [Myxococcota bacterium]|nr:hypothetical protein [Myxococcota bacterium]